MLLCLIRQAVYRMLFYSQLPEYLAIVHQAHPDGLQRTDACKLLAQLLDHFDRAFIVVDGLDECVPTGGDDHFLAGPPEIFSDINAIVAGIGRKARVIVSSRENFQKYYRYHSSIEVRASDVDVRDYVRTFVKSPVLFSNFSRQISENQNTEDMLVENITARADGL